ncbi:hypothetical protein MLD38_020370 [Melastoma candidum]|uniref:Uncharacterized protein n=1 Tax=Melastoma candidum TaxID=119954 RepID=A0ACB9QD74_9MYRT|nr:hypothetical protein MLD38_020370 [Melastoma candidum]
MNKHFRIFRSSGALHTRAPFPINLIFPSSCVTLPRGKAKRLSYAYRCFTTLHNQGNERYLHFIVCYLNPSLPTRDSGCSRMQLK